MVAGQMIDLEATGRRIEGGELEAMHLQKTAALISASVLLGALACDSGEAELQLLRGFGESLGLAFQIQDDILDIEGSSEQTGKAQGADLSLDKSTYVSLHGMTTAKSALAELAERSHAALRDLGPAADELHHLVDFVIHRGF